MTSVFREIGKGDLKKSMDSDKDQHSSAPRREEVEDFGALFENSMARLNKAIFEFNVLNISSIVNYINTRNIRANFTRGKIAFVPHDIIWSARI